MQKHKLYEIRTYGTNGFIIYIRNINIAATQDIYYIYEKNNIDIDMNKNLYMYDNVVCKRIAEHFALIFGFRMKR